MKEIIIISKGEKHICLVDNEDYDFVKDFSSSTMLVQNMSLMKQRELIALQNAISGRQLEA